MRKLRTIRSLYIIGSGMALLIVTLIPNEVEEEISSANQVILEAFVGDDPDSIAGKLKAEQALCPRRIDENTVLKSVSLWKLNHVKYLYEVNESGRPELVDMLGPKKKRAEVIDWTKKSHLGPMVVSKGLHLDHVFNDTDGKCMLWLRLEKMHFEDIEFEEPLTPDQVMRPEESPTAEDDRESMLATLISEQEKCPLEINEHVTLKQIEHLGKDRIKYHYTVSSAKHVSMNNQEEVEAEVIARMNASPLAPSIKKLDMQMQHFYKTPEGACTLWLNMTKKDLQTTEEKESEAEGSQESDIEDDAEAVADPEAGTDADEATESAEPWLPQEFKPTQRTNNNPAGIQLNPYAQ
jgi:hypothetical protein